MNKTKIIVVLTFFIVLVSVAFIHNYNRNQRMENYKKLVDKYQKQINELMSKNQLSDNKITKLTVDMKNRELIIMSLKTKLKNGKVDSVYLFNHYNLSPYGNIIYDMTLKDTLGHYVLTPKTRISDIGFLFHPNISVIYSQYLYPTIFATIFHYKNAGLEVGVSYKDTLYIDFGVNYFIWSNLLVKGGVMVNLNLKYKPYAGIGCNF